MSAAGRREGDTMKPRSSVERRWAALGEDGRHAWLGRHSDPSPAEITQIEAALVRQDLRGWIVVIQGDYWDPHAALNVLPVRSLGTAPVPFDEVLARFLAKRQDTFVSLDPQPPENPTGD